MMGSQLIENENGYLILSEDLETPLFTIRAGYPIAILKDGEVKALTREDLTD